MDETTGAAGESDRPDAEKKLPVRSVVLRSVPNALSLVRLALGLAFPFVSAGWRLAVLAIAGLTEFLDGFLARRFHTTGGAGQIIDPIADKVFMIAVLATLLWDGTLSLWQLLLLDSRDLLVTAGAIWVAATRGRSALTRMPPSILGKLATTAQLIFLLAVLMTQRVSIPLFVIASALSLLSGINYLMRGETARRVDLEEP